MQTSALASGSSGNCFFVESNKHSFLIDAGISCKQITERMEMIEKDPSDLTSIFITHEHTDHIKGVDVLARKYSIPVFITKKCHEACENIVSDASLINFIEKDKALNFKGMKITPLSKSHDANDPVSYSIIAEKKKISVMTDIGIACNNIINNIKDSNLIFMESNHDINMLKNGHYPIYLKRRILSSKGHLSNYAASLLILEHAPSKLKHLILSHISENNNTEKIALRTMKVLLGNRKDLRNLRISISGRYKPTELISI